MWLSNQTPTEPPSIDTMNMTNSIIVLEEVGNIYEAMRPVWLVLRIIKPSLNEINLQNT